ncbi:hypothetical protein MVEN_02013400 [Mycena venus]|uniref:Uncharacterized protein n=1 Tax=Mycena venus TaxID=2733690 RepID=A0A8H7CJ64_9AGAR|nr:hypothetical protein MVEN_02013400 [Mycena venus]
MTEYTSSSQALRDYLSSKERTKHWVHSRIEPPDECYSPNAAPSILQDPEFVLPPASDAGSTHSVPPKMVLRYSDGRPDQPIYDDPNAPPLKRGQARRVRHVCPKKSESYHLTLWTRHVLRPTPIPAPSHFRGTPIRKYKTLYLSCPHPHPSHHSGVAVGPGLPGPLPHPRPSLNVAFAQPPPQPWHQAGSHGRRHAPPPIVYAPSHRSRPHYAPPAIYTHPPKMGPNGMIYSHSAPVPSSHHPQKYPTPYPSMVASSAHMSSVNEEQRSGSRTPNRRDRSRSRNGAVRPSSPASSTSSFTSNGSGSTYYVMPTGRQKVHVIHTPDTSASLHTASSTSHSPTSPNSMKKQPLFQRLLVFAERRLFSSSGDSSRASSRGGRRLHRRHSTGGSGRSRSTPPGE